MNRKKRNLLVLLAAFAAGILIVYMADSNGRGETPLDFQGKVEAEEVKVAPRVTGRLAEFRVQEGDEVEEGELLFRLEAVGSSQSPPAKPEHTAIRSPVDGTVAYKAFNEGETVPAHQPVLAIIRADEKWVRFEADKRYLGRIRTEEEVQVTAPGVDRMFSGQVDGIGPAARADDAGGGEGARKFRVNVKVLDPEKLLKPGMTATVRVP